MTFFVFISNLFVNIGDWIKVQLTQWGFTATFAELAMRIIGALAMAFVPIVAVIFLIWEARKVIARIQDRMGPTNSGTYAGPFALLQTFADVIKIFTKNE